MVAVAAIFIVLHFINSTRLDMQGLRTGSDALVERANNIRDRAMPEYEDLVLATLPANPNNGPFYRLDDNLPEARVIDGDSLAETELDEGDEFEFQLEFEEGVTPGLIAADGRSQLELKDGLLVVRHAQGEYLVNDTPLSIPLANLSDFIIRARADKGNRFQLHWTAEGRESDLRDNSLSLDLIADGEFHTYFVNAKNAFSRGVEPGENISLLAISPSNVDGAIVEIDFIRIVSKQWKYQVQKVGTSYETLGGEGRPVLHVVPGQQLVYTVEVPAQQPVLSFGISSRLTNPAVDVSISVNTDDDSSQVFSVAGLNSDAWQDEAIDLSSWAGQSVQVSIDVQGGDGNVAFISNPMVRSAIRKPLNVVVILEDALRADYLSTYGHIRETSPQKTRLMNEHGALFLNAHSQATKTRPSIPSMMTSLYPTATGVWNFSDTLSDRYLTLAEIMRAQGFATASFIQNGNAGPYAGIHQGFSSLRDASSIGETTEGLFGEHVLDWIDSNSDRNFFLYLHAVDPHGIYDPPPPFDRWYREADPESLVGKKALPKSASIDPAWAETPSGEARRLLYDGEILHNDSVIDKFIKDLEARDLLDDTVLVFVSDHGEWMGEGGRWEHRPPGNRPVIHVPFMLSYPRLFDTPRQIEESVQLIDAMPTILDLASVDDSDLLLQGDSLVSLIQGNDSEHWQNRITVSEEPMIMKRYEDSCACGSLFYGPWQLHGSTSNTPRSLKSAIVKSGVYRFREDGMKPLVSFLPDLYTRYLRHQTLSDLKTANMATWRKLTEGEQQNVYKMDPAVLEELRGLGYVN
jgi:arylsulfatase A-like enzyme